VPSVGQHFLQPGWLAICDKDMFKTINELLKVGLKAQGYG
jgi:hypothetical protein